MNAIRNFRLRSVPALTQKDLGRRAGCHQQDISAYERGLVLPDLRMALKIAGALGARIDEVFWELCEESCGRMASERDASASAPSPSP